MWVDVVSVVLPAGPHSFSLSFVFINLICSFCSMKKLWLCSDYLDYFQGCILHDFSSHSCFWRNMARLTNVSQLLEEACGGREADACKTSVALVLYLQIRHVEGQQITFSLTQSRWWERSLWRSRVLGASFHYLFKQLICKLQSHVVQSFDSLFNLSCFTYTECKYGGWEWGIFLKEMPNAGCKQILQVPQPLFSRKAAKRYVFCLLPGFSSGLLV